MDAEKTQVNAEDSDGKEEEGRKAPLPYTLFALCGILF
jgi:hypothetical protein